MTRWRIADAPLWALIAIPCILAVAAGTVYGVVRRDIRRYRLNRLRRARAKQEINERWARAASVAATNYTAGIATASHFYRTQPPASPAVTHTGPQK